MNHHQAHQNKKTGTKSHALHGHHHSSHEHDKHEGHHTGDFLKRFWICLALTIPVLLLSEMIMRWFGFSISFQGDKLVLLLFSATIYLYGGWPFINGMIKEIMHRSIGMMTLVALAISVAFIYSFATLLGLEGMDFFWELATLTDIMLLGHWLEMRSQMKATKALESIVALLPRQVHIEKDNGIIDMDVMSLQKNDIIIIKPGEKIPADSIVLEGRSYVNESMLTGESKPVNKEADSGLFAGSINGDGSLRAKVTGAGDESYLNKIIHMVQSAQQSKSSNQVLADRVARWLTIVSIIVGVLTFIFWNFFRDNLSFSLERMVTVMVTACPHALGVAIPLVVAISTTKAAVNGFLIRNRSAFEKAGKITTIIFDKTGTLTHGSHAVQKIISTSNYTQNELLQYAASIEQHSEHYIGLGIIRKLKEEGLELWRSENFHYSKGKGVSGNVTGKLITVAGPNYFKEHSLTLPDIPPGINQDIESISYILIDNELAGIISIADTIRETAVEAIELLRKMKIKIFLVTGDNEKIAGALADKLKMDGFFANVLPHQKQEILKDFQTKGEIVAMTGDGVNDAPALAQADVGIAVGSGTDVAAETADIILVNSDPKDVAGIISFGKATYQKMVQNLFWAAGYNIIAIPLAAGVLYPAFTLSPAMGAVLMSLSTVIVAFNAGLLKKSMINNV